MTHTFDHEKQLNTHYGGDLKLNCVLPSWHYTHQPQTQSYFSLEFIYFKGLHHYIVQVFSSSTLADNLRFFCMVHLNKLPEFTLNITSVRVKLFYHNIRCFNGAIMSWLIRKYTEPTIYSLLTSYSSYDLPMTLVIIAVAFVRFMQNSSATLGLLNTSFEIYQWSIN